MSRSLLKIVFVLALTIDLDAGLASSTAAPLPSPRIVAVGDIHGDFDSLVAILQRAALLDSSHRWSGGDAILIQTGDFLDRGPKTRAVMDLLMSLQNEAPRQGGRVVVLLGNHEAMNIIGELRDTTAGDFSAYADDRSERRRKEAYAAHAALGDAVPQVPEAEWYTSHPLGFIEQRQALGPNGKYGRWLRSLPAVIKVDDSLFVHAGIDPTLASWDIKRINQAISSEIRAFDGYLKFMVEEKIALPFYTLREIAEAARTASVANREKLREGVLGFSRWMIIRQDGPLWFRGYARWTDDEGGPFVKQLSQSFGVVRFVVGHTPQPGKIISRFGGQVYLIDTGMLATSFTGGRASALEIQDGKIREIYADLFK